MKRTPCSSLEPSVLCYFCQSFTFTVLSYKFCYPWIPIPVVLEELSGSRRSKKSLKIGDGPETRDRARRAAETSEQRSEKLESEGRDVVLGTLLNLLVKVNAELRLLRREKPVS